MCFSNSKTYPWSGLINEKQSVTLPFPAFDAAFITVAKTSFYIHMTLLIHSFSLGHLLGQAEGQTIRGTSRDNGVVFAVMVKGRDWGPPDGMPHPC